GSKLAGLFNLGKDQRSIELLFHELNFKGKVKLRDIWEQNDLGIFEKSYLAKLPSHGVQLLKVTPFD
ncbi:MAG: alpha-galactosidase, partial [Athalassotoga sp.]